jgi:hypothetical protein
MRAGSTAGSAAATVDKTIDKAAASIHLREFFITSSPFRSASHSGESAASLTPADSNKGPEKLAVARHPSEALYNSEAGQAGMTVGLP